MTWKQVECPFEEDRAILHYLHTAPVFSEDGKNFLCFVELRSSFYFLSVLNILVSHGWMERKVQLQYSLKKSEVTFIKL